MTHLTKKQVASTLNMTAYDLERCIKSGLIKAHDRKCLETRRYEWSAVYINSIKDDFAEDGKLSSKFRTLKLKASRKTEAAYQNRLNGNAKADLFNSFLRRAV